MNSQRVDERIFYRLVQFFATCLFECKEEEDYVPAKHLMNMCFTFYYEGEYTVSIYLNNIIHQYDAKVL